MLLIFLMPAAPTLTQNTAVCHCVTHKIHTLSIVVTTLLLVFVVVVVVIIVVLVLQIHSYYLHSYTFIYIHIHAKLYRSLMLSPLTRLETELLLLLIMTKKYLTTTMHKTTATRSLYSCTI